MYIFQCEICCKVRYKEIYELEKYTKNSRHWKNIYNPEFHDAKPYVIGHMTIIESLYMKFIQCLRSTYSATVYQLLIFQCFRTKKMGILLWDFNEKFRDIFIGFLKRGQGLLGVFQLDFRGHNFFGICNRDFRLHVALRFFFFGRGR